MNLEKLSEKCAFGNEHITASPSAGGEPRAIGTGVTVSEILARIYALGQH